MKISKLLYLSIAMIAGCATSYQPSGFSGGFSEVQLDANVFRVSFIGNGYTSTEKAEEFALLRSAEITIKNNFTHFVIINSRSRQDLSSYTTPTNSYTTANATRFGNSAYGTASTTTYGGETTIIAKPNITNTIMCFGEKPVLQGLIYDAKFLCMSLGKKYNIVC
jgi:hypothetical protein